MESGRPTRRYSHASEEGLAVIPRANKTATFHAYMSETAAGIAFLPPMVSSSNPICDPHFDGQMRRGGMHVCELRGEMQLKIRAGQEF